MRVQLGKILTQACEGKYIDHPEREKYITVLLYGRGVKERTINEGKIPVQFNAWVAHTGQLIYSRINAENGAYAIVPNYLDGAVVSKDFPLYWIDTSQVLPDYLFYSLTSDAFVKKAQKNSVGATMRRLKEPVFESMEINLPTIEEQECIVSQIKRTISVIQGYQSHLTKLDQLIKARFVELFGDPVSNPKGWEKRALSDEAEIKIGPFGSLLHKEDYISGGHALINPSHIVDGSLSPDNGLTLTDEKYEELAPYHLLEGDVIMGRRGEMGRCAVVDRPGLLCGTGSLLIRSKGDLRADYIQRIISFPTFKRMIEDMAVGQTMPNLNVPIVSAFQIIKPPQAVQEQYYAFVYQVDKSKVVVQKALDQAKLLFDSLMQKYFG